MSNIFYDMIWERHNATFPEDQRPKIGETFDDEMWRPLIVHWYRCAAEIRNDFLEEGLTDSVAEMSRLIHLQLEFSRNPQERAAIERCLMETI